MNLMDWSIELSLGIKSIDDQHKELINLINILAEGMSNGEGPEVLADIFDRLIVYTDFHFQGEEKLFRHFGYPKEEEHKKKHEDLISQALTLQKKFKSGDLTISTETLNFLINWLKNHILKTDMEYAPFMLAAGVE